MDTLSLVVRAVCREVGVSSPIEAHRIQGRVLEALAEQCPGERLTLYVPKMAFSERARRHRAILAEHAAGDRVDELARRHGLSTRWVFKILARQRAVD